MDDNSKRITLVNAVALNTLIIALNLPYPPRGGVDLRGLQTVAAARSVGRVGVFALVRGDPGQPPFEGLDVWTTTTDPFLSDSPPGGGDLGWIAVEGALPTDRYFSEVAALEIEALIKAHRPETVIIDQLWLHGYVPAARRHGSRVVLNHHNAETALHRQLAEGATGGEKLIRRSLNLRVQQAEQRMLSTVDQVWVCSDGDRKAIVDEFDPTAEVTVIPNTVDVSAYSEALDHSAAKQVGLAYNRARVLFPAYFAYEPNRTAAQLLVDEIFPLLTTAEPDAELLLAGRSPTRELVAAAQSNPRITVTGAVPSMIPYLAAAGVVVVPLHHGSGTRIKILEAFASGVPVVSTAMGAAGLPVTNGLDITIAESPSALASAVAALWQDPGRASRQAEAALDLVRTELSWERTARLVGRALR